MTLFHTSLWGGHHPANEPVGTLDSNRIETVSKRVFTRELLDYSVFFLLFPLRVFFFSKKKNRRFAAKNTLKNFRRSAAKKKTRQNMTLHGENVP